MRITGKSDLESLRRCSYSERSAEEGELNWTMFIDTTSEFLVIRKKAGEQLREILSSGPRAEMADLRAVVMGACNHPTAWLIRRGVAKRNGAFLESIRVPLLVLPGVGLDLQLVHTDQPAPDGLKTMVFLLDAQRTEF